MKDELAISDTADLSAVTLCILCFNQRPYIRAALEAALRQAGSPIEIIVSDDGSTDGTLDVAHDIAADYRGPHRVIIRKTKRNLGTLNHVFDVAEIATGDLLIVGAADDISLPDRANTLVASWRREQSSALFSAYQIIDENGSVVDPHHRFDDRWLPIHDYFPGRDLVSIHGASSAYDRHRLLALPRPSSRVLFEDTWLTLMLTLLDQRITFVDQPLVQYRQHAESTTNYGARNHITKSAIITANQQVFRRAGFYRDAVQSFRDEVIALGCSATVAMDVVDRDLTFYSGQAAWASLPWHAKMTVMLQARQRWMRRWAMLHLLSPGLRIAVDRGRALARRGRRG